MIVAKIYFPVRFVDDHRDPLVVKANSIETINAFAKRSADTDVRIKVLVGDAAIKHSKYAFEIKEEK